MNRDSLLKHLLGGLILALVIYLASFALIQHLRTRKGGWDVRFQTDAVGAPRLELNQPWLGVTNVQVLFPGARTPLTNFATTIVFDRPVTNIPFGKVVYLDTTFLPGAIAFGMFGHEVQLLPRALLLDRRPVPWQRGSVHELPAGSQKVDGLRP